MLTSLNNKGTTVIAHGSTIGPRGAPGNLLEIIPIENIPSYSAVALKDGNFVLADVNSPDRILVVGITKEQINANTRGKLYINGLIESTLSVPSNAKLYLGESGQLITDVSEYEDKILIGYTANPNLIYIAIAPAASANSQIIYDLEAAISDIGSLDDFNTYDGQSDPTNLAETIANELSVTKLEIDQQFAQTKLEIDDKIPLGYMGVANGVATLDSSGKVPKEQLEQSLNDVLIQTISNISAASGTFELLSQTPVSIVEENQKIEIQQSVQSSDSTIFQIDEPNSLIKITRDLPFTVMSNVVAETVGEGELSITFIDKDNQTVLSTFTKTINNQLVEINQSSLINVGRFLTPTFVCNVEIVITCTCESCIINKFTGIIIASFGSGKVITTNPLPIAGNSADIGYNINGDIVLNTALVFLDLTEDDFDINGKLINNRNYLIEEHYGVRVDGSFIIFDTDLTDKYTVISHAQ
jgi:hypothetical protein